MKQEERTVYFDEQLKLEVYEFKGIAQKFSKHFHDYYVIGFVENGQRDFFCNGKQYFLKAGDVILINPDDTHGCEQVGQDNLHYFSFNIKKEVMEKVVEEITGERYLPHFNNNIISIEELCISLQDLKSMIVEEQIDFKKEEMFLFLMEQLINDVSDPVESLEKKELSIEIKSICTYLEENFNRNISLDELSLFVGLSKFYLLRFFTKEVGISPHRYLETIRIEKAKQMLQQGVSIIEVAIKTGYSDQSHFTNFFRYFIGLTPKAYQSIFLESKVKREGEGDE